MSLHFTSNATFDIGIDLDWPVSLDYFDQAPFAVDGTIGKTTTLVSEEIAVRSPATPATRDPTGASLPARPLGICRQGLLAGAVG
jgi:hypothetical protein